MKVSLPKLKNQLLAMLIGILLAQTAWAQNPRKADIIILRDETKLEVLIQEVTDNAIKYKKLSDPEGPVFNVRKDEVVSIQYGNGEVETFEAVLEVPSYYAPSQTQKTPKPENNPYNNVTTVRPKTGNKFLDEIRSSTPDHLRATYKYYKAKSKSGMIMGIAGTSAGILVAAIGTGIVVGVETDANGNFATYQDQQRALRGAWMMLGGFAGAVTFGTVGFVKGGRNGSKASRIRRELLQRNEPITFQLGPGFNPINGAGYLTLKMKF
ncbi:hypothetical protein [Dyadobacter luticola]|uniref:Uncharacterized protein n=1 Tax=Dyadobacter luticola TaxID=1979387 RepID=A0A5R9KP32_9BACT|nr:hypothetical protein [Dyadobacter luticola]TLU97856.1 hypothetical protein FEN17_23965 [Dyadobacter luticola]